MRKLSITLSSLIFFLLLIPPAIAKDTGMLGTLAVGAGYNQATKNAADETFCISVKERLNKWQYGLDGCMSEDRGGVGKNKFGFVWAAWYDDFQRPDWQDYGVYGGVGAGVFLLQQDFVDWPAGPVAVLGWDLSAQAGLEGKIGYFGENIWGTANFYWYFK